MNRVVAIIQARTGSSRLPKKVLMDIAGKPMLQHVIERASASTRVDEVWVATTDEPGDDALVELGESLATPCFRGDENDVLDRYYRAATDARADVVVRLTADCPLLDPTLVDQVIEALDEETDYAANVLPPRTYPRGLDTEVFHYAALERAWREDSDPASREHVTPYIYRNSDKFRLKPVRQEQDHSHLRWTVDTEADLELVRRLAGALPAGVTAWSETLEVLSAEPSWQHLNRHVRQKSVPR